MASSVRAGRGSRRGRFFEFVEHDILVVIELKRTEDGGHVELQTFRCAAMISTMTFDRAVDDYAAFL